MSSIDYFSLSGIPYVLIAWLGIWLIRPLATFFHELGHSLVACFLTSGEVSLRVGRPGGKLFRLSENFTIELSPRNGQEGLTTFSVKGLAKPLWLLTSQFQKTERQIKIIHCWLTI